MALIGLVKPGSWIQLMEGDFSGQLAKNTPALEAWYALLRELQMHSGVGHEFWRELRGWFEEVGLVSVKNKVFDIPLGARNPKVEMGIKGTRTVMGTTESILEGLKRQAHLPVSHEKVAALITQLEQEVPKRGGLYRVYTIWGRRPPN
ncbi:MAG: hypothetical protein M1834_000987 [Cirrosporium novae-zelandiae]|nr:MAG: hypothetical protein M1834_000987 [Cirrosporium novae-zelandiae]